MEKLKGFKFKLVQDDNSGCTYYNNDDDYNDEPIDYDGSDRQTIILYSKEQIENAGININEVEE